MANGANIGLRITLNGTDQVIKSVKDLETAIKSAREALAGKEIGSAEFKKLTGEISRAEGKLKDLQKRAEGINLEKRVGDFTKFGAAITASFAGAVAAVNLFGADTEKVSKAAAAAQNVLTIALAARSAAEGVAAFSTVALTVETYALAAAEYVASTATGVLATALRALFATIAANPIGAILVVIGLLIAGIVALTSSTEDAKEAEEAYQRTLERGAAIRADQLRLLQAQGAAEDVIARKRLENARADALDAQNQLNRAIQQGKSIKEIEDLRTKAEAAKRNVLIEGATLETTIRRKAEKERDEAQRKEKERLDERKRLIEENARVALEALAKEKEKFEELLRVLEQEVPEPPVLTLLRAQVDASKQLIQSSPVKTFGEIIQAFKDGPPPIKATREELDKFGTFIIKELPSLRVITKNFFNVTAQQFDDFRNRLSEGIRSGEFSKEAFDAGLELVNAYDKIRLLTEGKLEGIGEAGGVINISGIKNALVEYKIAAGDVLYTYDFVNGQVVETKLTTNKKLTEADQAYQNQLEFNTTRVYNYLLKNDENIKKILVKSQAEGEAAARARATEIVNSFVAIETSILETEQTIGTFYSDISKQQTERQKLESKALIGVIRENADLLIKEGQNSYDIDSAAFEEYIQNKISSLIDYTTLDAEGLKQLEELYALFYQKVGEMRAKNRADEKADFDERIRKTEQLIRDIQSALTSVSQTIGDFYAYQLDRLDKQQEASLEKIVGDTEEANAKRLELDKAYQTKRAELEKQAQKRQLQLTLLQAIADGAAAIVTVIKQTGVFASIAAGIVAASTAAQIGIISAQLNSINKYRRGGRIQRFSEGGIVVGPPHEFGGVKYQGGGIELEGSEAVINRVSSVRYGSLLSEINQAGGGKPLVVNNFDDSRIVEAIAKQRREPLRAYVLEQDITNKQAITKRLEQLSQI